MNVLLVDRDGFSKVIQVAQVQPVIKYRCVSKLSPVPNGFGHETYVETMGELKEFKNSGERTPPPQVMQVYKEIT